jgi:hypothetical protein
MYTEALAHLILSVLKNLFWGYAFGLALIALVNVWERIAYPRQRQSQADSAEIANSRAGFRRLGN